MERGMVNRENNERDEAAPYERILEVLLHHGSTSFTYEHIAVRR